MTQTSQQQLTLATLNVRTLSPHLHTVVHLFHKHKLDLLCLQETHIHSTGSRAIHTACQKPGLTLHIGTQNNSRSNIAILSIRPTAPWHHPALTDQDRVQILQVHRPRQRPLLVANVYGHAENNPARDELLTKVAHILRDTDEDFVILGDFNCTMGEGAIAYLLANGILHDANASFYNWEPTRPAGNRCIDYALTSPAMHPATKHQTHGPSDHDLVIYSFPGSHHTSTPALTKPAFRKLDPTANPTDADYLQLLPEQALHAYLKNSEVDAAWRLLSNTAEDLLAAHQPSTGPRRYDSWQATPTPPQSRHSNTPEPIRLRRLRRLHRTAAEVLRNPAHLETHRALYRRLQSLRQLYPQLQQTHTAQDIHHTTQTILQDQTTTLSHRRLHQWMDRTDDDPQAQRRWIRNQEVFDKIIAQHQPRPPDPTAAAPGILQAIHPQDQVEQAAKTWQQLWNKPHAADSAAPPHTPWHAACPAHLQNLQQWLPPTQTQHSLQPITTQQLLKAAKRIKHKAPGGDGWTAAALLQLPPQWWQHFTQLWNTCIQQGTVPKAWTRTVVILLAKPTGGTRPISLTGICWRMGATALVRQLHTWTNTWLPSNMVGGIAGRHAAYLHARLHHAIAQNRHGHLTVLSQDLTKAFDSIHIQQALSILHHFGAPTNITQLILHFYNTCQRTFSFGGCIHPHWHTATHGILQGCPFSPLLLNTVMTIWAHALHQHPQLHTGIFFDDRSVWATGPQAATHIAQAIHTSHTIDAKLGFTENQSKTQIAAANHTQRHITDATVPAGYPPASSTFKLLGLRYDLAAAKPVTIDPEAIARYEARTRRIPLVTRRFPWRRLHLRTLAFPIITWGGTFASPAPKQLARMRTACARTIIGWLPRGSSKHNLWTTTLQPQDDLEYNFLHQALSTLTWITRARETPTPWQQQTHYPFLSQDPQQWAPPLKAALRALKWTWHNDTNTLSRQDAHGRTRWLRFGWDGNHILHTWLQEAWTTKLYHQERRVWRPSYRNDPNIASGLRLPKPHANHTPVMAAHRTYRPSSTLAPALEWQCIHATGTTAWQTAKRHHQPLKPCFCGKVAPSMPHLLWVCPALQPDRRTMVQTAPTNTCEERLLTRPIPPDPRPFFPTQTPPPVPSSLTSALQTHLQLHWLSHNPITLATDGGAHNGIAAWAIAWDKHVFADLIQGEDQTPYAAEVVALTTLYQALATAAETLSPQPALTCIIAVDCTSAIHLAHQDYPPDQYFQFYNSIQRSQQRLRHQGLQVYLEWTPSHDKRPDWSPRRGNPTLLRQLNAQADAAATRCLQPTLYRLAPWLLQHARATAWAQTTLQWAQHVARRFDAFLAPTS